ncbi:toxin CptA [Gammaproteobacteria bacterium]
MNILSSKFQLQKSWTLCMLFLFMHMGAIFCIGFMPFVFWGKIAFVVCVLVHSIMVLRIYALRNSFRAIVELWQNGSGSWYLKNRSEDVEQVLLSKPLFISNYLIVLNFISAKKFLKIVVPIAKDAMVKEDDFRKLKVLLRYF